MIDDLTWKPKKNLQTNIVTLGELIRFNGLEINIQNNYTSLLSNK